ncbi:MAG: hypothetical protein J6V80_00030 [Clostridia bacterium]|nr:hypothetical protein [Clostridia bacterium]
MANKCCMCDRHIEREDAPVLSMGAAGIPRLLCDNCAILLDTATLGENYDEIKGAMETISDIMSANDPDGVTYSIVSELMVSASERAKAIKDGTYDFSLDEEEGEDQLEDIPEDMLESEEDKQKDEADEIKLKRFDKVYNAIFIAISIATALFIIYKVLDNFLF